MSKKEKLYWYFVEKLYVGYVFSDYHGTLYYKTP